MVKTKKDIGIFSATGDNSSYLNDVDAAIEKAKQNLIDAVKQRQNVLVDKAQGFYAEDYHAATFNVDAAVKRMRDLHASTLGRNDLNSPDISIEYHGEKVKEYSSKYWATAKQSVDEQKPYDDMGRLIPSDQLDAAHEHLKKQIPKELAKEGLNRRQVAEELQDVQDNLDSKIQHGGVESQELGRKESERQLKKIRQGEAPIIEPKIDFERIVDESLRSGAVAGAITMASIAAPRIIGAVTYRVKKGEWEPDIFERVFKETATATGLAALRATVATSITMSAKAGLLGSSMKAADPTMIGTLTYLAFEGAKEYYRFRKGEIDGAEFADLMMNKSIVAAGGALGATIGQTLIPIPIVGAMVGAMVGSMLSGQAYNCLNYISDAYFHSKEFEEIKKISLSLAQQWNIFCSDYSLWKKSSIAYNLMFKLTLENIDKLDRKSDYLRRQLSALLGESNNDKRSN